MEPMRSDEWPSLLPTTPRLRQASLVFILVPLLVLIGLIVIEQNATSSGNGSNYYNGGGSGYPYVPYSSATTGYGYTDTSTYYGYTETPSATDTTGYGYGDTTTPTPSDTSSATPSTSASPTDSGPAGTVEAYFNAINAANYQLAWQLGGDNSNQTYDQFVSGLSSTQSDVVTPQSVNGNVVTATLVATNKDGTTKSFSGQYTVTNGVITHFNVQQTSG